MGSSFPNKTTAVPSVLTHTGHAHFTACCTQNQKHSCRGSIQTRLMQCTHRDDGYMNDWQLFAPKICFLTSKYCCCYIWEANWLGVCEQSRMLTKPTFLILAALYLMWSVPSGRSFFFSADVLIMFYLGLSKLTNCAKCHTEGDNSSNAMLGSVSTASIGLMLCRKCNVDYIRWLHAPYCAFICACTGMSSRCFISNWLFPMARIETNLHLKIE